MLLLELLKHQITDQHNDEQQLRPILNCHRNKNNAGNTVHSKQP